MQYKIFGSRTSSITKESVVIHVRMHILIHNVHTVKTLAQISALKLMLCYRKLDVRQFS